MWNVESGTTGKQRLSSLFAPLVLPAVAQQYRPPQRKQNRTRQNPSLGSPSPHGVLLTSVPASASHLCALFPHQKFVSPNELISCSSQIPNSILTTLFWRHMPSPKDVTWLMDVSWSGALQFDRRFGKSDHLGFATHYKIAVPATRPVYLQDDGSSLPFSLSCRRIPTKKHVFLYYKTPPNL